MVVSEFQKPISFAYKSASSVTKARTPFLDLVRLQIFKNENFGTANKVFIGDLVKTKLKNKTKIYYCKLLAKKKV